MNEEDRRVIQEEWMRILRSDLLEELKSNVLEKHGVNDSTKRSERKRILALDLRYQLAEELVDDINSEKELREFFDILSKNPSTDKQDALPIQDAVREVFEVYKNLRVQYSTSTQVELIDRKYLDKEKRPMASYRDWDYNDLDIEVSNMSKTAIAYMHQYSYMSQMRQNISSKKLEEKYIKTTEDAAKIYYKVSDICRQISEREETAKGSENLRKRLNYDITIVESNDEIQSQDEKERTEDKRIVDQEQI